MASSQLRPRIGLAMSFSFLADIGRFVDFASEKSRVAFEIHGFSGRDGGASVFWRFVEKNDLKLFWSEIVGDILELMIEDGLDAGFDILALVVGTSLANL
eukprot:CAMPEP_0185273388 /NCGR_PEP_ID=MMETSP1359-20130426/49385_1 /TAXON_ID=552665 /ORGANISM="Bigelowiella longifila, Strain CCMP242" /LENGTH=99 /DNA_ID=CAMNT_0027865987 /DNA_START=543 /DNA_END=839 /DNA_ORIENTATION=+